MKARKRPSQPEPTPPAASEHSAGMQAISALLETIPPKDQAAAVRLMLTVGITYMRVPRVSEEDDAS